MDQNKKPREQTFMRELVSDWRPTRGQVLWTIRIVILLAVVLTILTLIGLPFDITLYDWLDLLIVPVVIAVGGYLFNSSQNRATEAATERRARDEALQAFLEHMSGMLLPGTDRPSLYRAQRGDSLSSVARARTLTVLRRLDGTRKARVVQFLREAGLIDRNNAIVVLRDADLGGANLLGVDLSEADLSGADLHSADLMASKLFRSNLFEADLSGADLLGTNLFEADLRGAMLARSGLQEADLRRAKLGGAQLPFADLRGAMLGGADLRGADLNKVDLSEADLSEAKLYRADLIGSDVSGATLDRSDLRETSLFDLRGWTEDQLTTANTLQGATMPDGQILKSDNNPEGPTFEEWLKDKEGRKEDGEND